MVEFRNIVIFIISTCIFRCDSIFSPHQALKVETLKAEMLKAETLKAETLKAETLKVEVVNILDMMGLCKSGTGKYFKRCLYFILDQKHTHFYM